MKRVLLTGATGFIGRACIEPLLARGFEVHAVGNAHQHAAPATWHRFDLLSRDPGELVAATAPTHLLHLAWYAAPGKYWTSPLNLSWVRASLALYEAFSAAGGSRVVIGGTSAEYDWTGAGTLDEETTPLRPNTYYGTCKHALQQIVAADAKARPFSAAWARFFFLYGPHEYPERLIASVIRDLLQGKTARCSPGDQLRDFIHVADAAAATVELLDSDVRGPVNIGTGHAVTVKSLVETIAAQIGTGRADLGALPADPTPLIRAATQRLREEVGFSPVIDHERRLRETIAWWREHIA